MSDRDQSSKTSTRLGEVASGNIQAFNEFCSDALPWLVRYTRAQCRRFHIPDDLADDFAQDAIIRGIVWIREHPTAELGHGWLRLVARNQMVDWLRARHTESTLHEESVATTDTATGHNEDDRLVWNAFYSLSADDQSVIELLLLKGESPAAVAKSLGLSRWAVYKRYQRALQRMRTYYSSSHD